MFRRILARNASIFRKIQALPFNQQIGRGTLPSRVFQFYLQQDSLYLRDFAIALDTLAFRFSEKRYREQFQHLSLRMTLAVSDSFSQSMQFEHDFFQAVPAGLAPMVVIDSDMKFF